jgi:hypothetical protein
MANRTGEDARTEQLLPSDPALARKLRERQLLELGDVPKDTRFIGVTPEGVTVRPSGPGADLSVQPVDVPRVTDRRQRRKRMERRMGPRLRPTTTEDVGGGQGTQVRRAVDGTDGASKASEGDGAGKGPPQSVQEAVDQVRSDVRRVSEGKLPETATGGVSIATGLGLLLRALL